MGGGGVGTGMGIGQVGGEHEERNGDDAHPWVAVGSAVGGQLFKMTGHLAQARLLPQLADGGLVQVFVGVNEPPGQGQAVGERGFAASNQQDMESILADGEDDQVNRDGEGWEPRRRRAGGLHDGSIYRHLDENYLDGLSSN
jgi:hypothetical protein